MFKLKIKKIAILTYEQFEDNADIIKDIGEDYWLATKTEATGDKKIEIKQNPYLCGPYMPKTYFKHVFLSNVLYFSADRRTDPNAFGLWNGEPGVYHGGHDVREECGIRPVLYIEDANHLKPGTQIFIQDKPYTVLNDGLILADFIIATSIYNYKKGMNNYKNSIVKKYIIAWSSVNFAPDYIVDAIEQGEN